MARKQVVYRSATVTVEYEPDRRSIARLAVGPKLTAVVHHIAENVAKPYAVSISPRKTGAYAQSFETSISSIALGDPELMTRVIAELANTDPGAGGIEWGKGRQNGHHTLGKTLAWLHHNRPGDDVAAEDRHMDEHFDPADVQQIERGRFLSDAAVAFWEQNPPGRFGSRP